MRDDGEVRLCVAGDVMLGRGIDQILPFPCEPGLHETSVRSATRYVELAERVNGPIPRAADFTYVWGDALAELERRRPDLWLINLETSITTSTDWEAKGINYRMNPLNTGVITAAHVDCCNLANNHLLDWGKAGLRETLRRTGIATVGAGHNRTQAETPAILPVPGGRVLVFAFGLPSSGIPSTWGATEAMPGVNFLLQPSAAAVEQIADSIRAIREPGDIVVVSLHWGSNWGYDVPCEHSCFAHGLIDHGGVDIVFGHSSHHPKAVEVYNGKLILYGCGDLINDYEGIGGEGAFRGDLVLLYFATLRHKDGGLADLTLIPLQIRNFRLNSLTLSCINTRD